MNKVRHKNSNLAVVNIAESRSWSKLLKTQYDAVRTSTLSDRPWLYWELHNPWSRAAVCVDSWSILDLCGAPALVDRIAERIGEDIILFDSQILPNPCLPETGNSKWTCDEPIFPLDKPDGIVVRIPFGTAGSRRYDYRGKESGSVEIEDGAVILHTPSVEYRTVTETNAAPLEYVIRYFPANRLYQRDPGHPAQAELTVRYPWINYARMPLWLVHGEDRAGNDFVTGFNVRPGRWTAARSALSSL